MQYFIACGLFIGLENINCTMSLFKLNKFLKLRKFGPEAGLLFKY
jgi:hypothetical protein